jgi:hypothetical protein
VWHVHVPDKKARFVESATSPTGRKRLASLDPGVWIWDRAQKNNSDLKLFVTTAVRNPKVVAFGACWGVVS